MTTSVDQVVKVYEEAVDLMDKRTQGDYRSDDNALRFSTFELRASPSKPTPSISTSEESVIRSLN